MSSFCMKYPTYKWGSEKLEGEEGRVNEKRMGGGVVLKVSLTILRNFADSLARVDHVRPAQSVPWAVLGVSWPRIGWARVVSIRGCPKICIRDGRGRDRCSFCICFLLLHSP